MSSTPTDALLFITPVCTHCPAVLRSLGELVKQSSIGKLTVVNIAAHPEQAAEYGVRSAPWVRLGPFTLTGALSTDELRQWAQWAAGEEGIAHYVGHLLKEGDYKHAVAFISGDTHRLKALLSIVADPDANISVRLGVSALLEAYSNTAALEALLPQLADLSRHPDHRVRADACYLLGLTGSAAARDHVADRLGDDSEEVRDIAKDAMEALGAAK
jgi:thioredoxin-like negative regulator of GroEL